MVIGDFYLVCVLSDPTKTHSELIVDPNTVPPGAITLQLLKPVARRETQFFEVGGGFKLG